MDVCESNRLFVDANVLQEVSEVTPSSLVDVGEDSVLELSVVLLLGVGADFSVHLVPEDVLISKEVLYFGLFDGHTFLLGVLHGIFMMLESVFESEILLL